MVRHPFTTDLLGTAAFAHGVEQLDPVGVDAPEHGHGGQEDLRPVLMGHEEAKEPGALGEPREQRPIVACQPAIERPVAPAFEGMEQPQGDHAGLHAPTSLEEMHDYDNRTSMYYFILLVCKRLTPLVIIV